VGYCLHCSLLETETQGWHSFFASMGSYSFSGSSSQEKWQVDDQPDQYHQLQQREQRGDREHLVAEEVERQNRLDQL